LIHVSDGFFLQTLQRLADSWRNAIGSSALSILIGFFESQDDLRESDEKRAEFADYALDKLRFCYKKANGDDEEVSALHVWCMCILVTLLNTGVSRTLSRIIYH
jgi:hypothetical protein